MESDTIQVEWMEESKQVSEIPELEQGKICEEADSVQKADLKIPELTQVREGGRTYLLCACEAVCDDEEAMLADNRSEGLLPVTKKCVNGQMQLSYDITGKLSLTGYYGKKEIIYGDLCAILLSVHCCLNKMEEYLLSEDHLVFCPAHLYTNMAGRQLYFVYLPALRGEFSEHIRELAHFLMDHVDYQDERTVALAGQFYQYAEAENFSMSVFLEENRGYFEQTGAQKEHDSQKDLSAEEWQMQEETGYLPETEQRPDRGKQMVLAGLAVILMIGFVAWPFRWNISVLIAAGACAGMAAGVVCQYAKRAKRTLVKKERELFFLHMGTPKKNVNKADGCPAQRAGEETFPAE